MNHPFLQASDGASWTRSIASYSHHPKSRFKMLSYSSPYGSVATGVIGALGSFNLLFQIPDQFSFSLQLLGCLSLFCLLSSFINGHYSKISISLISRALLGLRKFCLDDRVREKLLRGSGSGEIS